MTRRISLQNMFDIAWRLAVLALPWQTRWFQDASLAGWPWEQGRLSLYASWGFLLLAILFGFLRFGRPRKIPLPVSISVASLSALCVFAAFRFPDAASAIVQWWAEAGILTLFVIVLRRARVPFRSLSFWFVLSVLPHAALGFVQYATQRVVGHSAAGIATQLPESLGVSVVEYADKRLLRAYGGFPHPNIFGGWLAMGVLACVTLAARATSKRQALLASAASATLSVALLITYSRSAWIAACVGVAMLFIQLFRSKKLSQFFLVAGAVSVLAVGIVGASQREAVLARTDVTTRLEAKSIDGRAQSLRDGIALFIAHPFLGSGPNAELLRLAEGKEKLPAPLEPPHNVFLLAAVNVGMIGGVFLLLLLGLGIQARRRRLGEAAPTIAILFGLAVFDHYLWSFWAGLSLFAIGVALIVSSAED